MQLIKFRMLITMMLASLSFGLAAQMVNGLPDIRYQQHIDSSADLSEELLLLSEAGIPSAQVLYADILSENTSPASLKQASYWYQKSFKNGTAIVRSITSLARLSDQYQWLADYNFEFFNQVYLQSEFDQNPQFVIGGLEIFITYPDFFQQDTVEHLITLHKRACIEDCQGALYQAVKTAQFNSFSDAESDFVIAAKESARAVRLYFDALPEDDKFQNFTRFSNLLKEEVELVNPDSRLSIANRLRNLSEEFNQDVIFWLDQAIKSEVTDAYAVRAEYMLSYPLNFSYQDTQKVIDHVSTLNPQKAQLLQASLHIVREWKKLKPHKAYEILSELDVQGVREATIGLGDLYSMGGLDQVDQEQAIKTYLRAAQQGNSIGYQKVANVYRSGRGIKNDKIRAFGFGKLASYMGNAGSDIFLEKLVADMKPEELNQAEKKYQQLLEMYVVNKEGSL